MVSNPFYVLKSSDDEPREEKDHFVAQLYKFMDDRGTPINKGPTIGTRDVDLYKLFKVNSSYCFGVYCLTFVGSDCVYF